MKKISQYFQCKTGSAPKHQVDASKIDSSDAIQSPTVKYLVGRPTKECYVHTLQPYGIGGDDSRQERPIDKMTSASRQTISFTS